MQLLRFFNGVEALYGQFDTKPTFPLCCDGSNCLDEVESSNSIIHYSLFKPSILKTRLNYFYFDLSKCETRVNDTQQPEQFSKQ